MTNTETSIRTTLAGLGLFKGALPRTLDYFAAHFVEMRYRAGACISLQGTEAFLFSIVLEGDVEVLRRTDDALVSLYAVANGQPACLAAASGEPKNDCTVVAVSDTLTLAISGEQFRKAIRDDSRVWKNLEEAVAEHEQRLKAPPPAAADHPDHRDDRLYHRNSNPQE